MTTTRSTATSTTPTTTQVSPPVWARALIAGGASALLNVAIVTLGAGAGASLEMNGDVVTWPAVVIASIVPVAVGGLVVWLLARRWPKARVVFAWVGLVLAVVSLGAVLAAPDTATMLTLGAMHLAVGVAWFVALTVRTPRA